MFASSVRTRRLAVLFALIVLTILVSWTARGATLETLVMPGPVSEAHVEIEADCNGCHASFDRDSQRALCLDCHEEIAQDIATGQGFHSLNPRVAELECRQCHTEHKGRNADIVGLVPELFDHDLTDFPLEGQHQDANCTSCHQPEQSSSAFSFRDADSTCVACHKEDDEHRGQLGDDCASCHTVKAWNLPTFDHDSGTGFALTGAHSETACAACHVDQEYESTLTECAGCHAQDDVHNGARGEQCATCHNTENWQSAEFDHDTETDYALLGAHVELACSSCHLNDMSTKSPPTNCIGCHSANDPHLGKNGNECQSCHRQDSWAVEFDHNVETDFTLRGRHSSLECSQCHQGALTDSLGTTCFACHVEDDPHRGDLATCEDCHSERSWTLDIKFHHDLTNFPLLGGHQTVACEQCHDKLSFSNALGALCVDCHVSDDVHKRSLGKQCGSCHTPVAWELWRFNHDTRTAFPLSGGHESLVCAACHEPGRSQLPSKTCIGCHRGDDIHRGSFGANCARCHSDESFASPRIGRSE